MDGQVSELLAIAAAVVALSTGYGRAFGRYQYQIVEWFVAGMAVPSRYRGFLNLGVGVILAVLFAAVAAWQAGEPGLVALGFLAGILASVEAAGVHDGRAAPDTGARAIPRPDDWAASLGTEPSPRIGHRPSGAVPR